MNYLQALAALGNMALLILLPAVITMAVILWGIKTNDLHTIERRLARIMEKLGMDDGG